MFTEHPIFVVFLAAVAAPLIGAALLSLPVYPTAARVLLARAANVPCSNTAPCHPPTQEVQ